MCKPDGEGNMCNPNDEYREQCKGCVAREFWNKYSRVLDITNLVPMGDVVIAKPIQFEKVSKGGIIIPPGSDQPVTGIVVAVGPGKILKNGTRNPMKVKVGDHILFSKHSHLDMKVDGEHLKIVREDSIVGVITEVSTTMGNNDMVNHLHQNKMRGET